jgi:hypothetical protein
MQTELHLLLKPSSSDWDHWQELVKESNHPSAFADVFFLKNHAHPKTRTALVLVKQGKKCVGGMPLFYRQSLLIRWLAQVPFIQRCVWVGDKPDKEQKLELTNLVKRNFVKGVFNSEIDMLRVENERFNCFLVKTELWRNQYSKDLSKNLRKAKKESFRIESDPSSLEEIIQLYRKAYGGLNSYLKDIHYSLFKKITEIALTHNKALLLSVRYSDQEDMLAGLVFWKGRSRYHYVMGAPTKEGRNCNALSVALDYMLEHVLENKETLDFEGSSIPSVRRFYNTFGGEEEVFFTVKR